MDLIYWKSGKGTWREYTTNTPNTPNLLYYLRLLHTDYVLGPRPTKMTLVLSS